MRISAVAHAVPVGPDQDISLKYRNGTRKREQYRSGPVQQMVHPRWDHQGAPGGL